MALLTLRNLLELKPDDIPDVVAQIFQDPDHWNWAEQDGSKALVHTLRDINVVRAVRKPNGEGEDSTKWQGLISEAFGQTLHGLENVEKNAQVGFLTLWIELANYPQIWGYDPAKPNDYFDWASGYLGGNAYGKYGRFLNKQFQHLLKTYTGLTVPEVVIRPDGTLVPERVFQMAADEIGQRELKVTPEEFVEIVNDLHDPQVDQPEYRRRRATREQRRTGTVPVEKGTALVLDRGEKGFVIVISLRGNTITNGFMRHIEPYIEPYQNAASTDEAVRRITE